MPIRVYIFLWLMIRRKLLTIEISFEEVELCPICVTCVELSKKHLNTYLRTAHSLFTISYDYSLFTIYPPQPNSTAAAAHKQSILAKN
jgi:hypothetical protein